MRRHFLRYPAFGVAPAYELGGNSVETYYTQNHAQTALMLETTHSMDALLHRHRPQSDPQDQGLPEQENVPLDSFQADDASQ